MNFDFPAFLVSATLLTGGIWAFDGIFLAPRRRKHAQGAGAHAKESWVVEYARSFFPVLLIVLLLRSFLVEPFRIPSGSMMPTLLVGDFILVNKFAYGLRWPVLNTKFLEIGEPQRGDVVVFRFPNDPGTDYIKRVVGLPGDQLYYRNKILYINGKPMPQTYLEPFVGDGESGQRMRGAEVREEQLGEVAHRILVYPGVPDLPPGCRVLLYGPVTVPEGHYFVMGDNRDNSNDSRCWGWMPEKNLVGKAFAIWMNWDSTRAGFPIDWHRIGTLIR